MMVDQPLIADSPLIQVSNKKTEIKALFHRKIAQSVMVDEEIKSNNK